ncbi:hypothetical protein M433DRAFT_77102, partial [Acidomyces richmondensis BFW]
VLGAEHPSTLTNMANLASTYRNQGRWREAEELEVKVMERRREILGKEHPDTLASMNNLALTYWNQGRWEEAEKLQIQVMEIRRTMLGAEHASMLTSMGNLASIYANQGRWDEAEKLGAQVMEMSEKLLGVEHPSTLTSMNNLALTYRDQGRLKEAEALELRVFEVMKTVLGERHPDTLTSMKNLALIYANGSQWEQAEHLQLQVLVASQDIFGPEHPSTLGSMGNLASTYRDQARFKEAEELETQVMAISKRILGEEHPSTLASMANLASTYVRQGRFVEAAVLDRNVMELRRKVLGELHPSTVRVMHRLAVTYQRLMQLQSAEKLELQVLKIRIKTLGQTHPDTLESVSALASIRSSQREQNSQVAPDDQSSSSELSSNGTSPTLNPSSTTSYPNHEQGALALITDCFTLDPDLTSLYTEAATMVRQERFLRKIAEALEHLSQDLRVEAPSSLKPHLEALLGSRRRRQLVLTSMCDRLKLFEPVSVDSADASNEAQSEQLGINIIKWIDGVSSSNSLGSRGLPIMQFRLLEDDESHNPHSVSESDESDEAVDEPPRHVLEQASNFVAGSAAFKSYKYRIGQIIHPYFRLDVTLAENDVNAVCDLLEEKFDAVAKGPWKWLHELRDMNFSMMEIAELLLEERNDHPWIYFTSWMDEKQKPHLGLHISGCVHSGGQSATWTQDDQDKQDQQLHVLDVNDCVESIREDVAALCGLAGVIPPADRHAQWTGEVLLENDTTACITYHTEGASPGIIWTRIQNALNRFCAAFAAVQQSGKCCDSFTLLRHSSSPLVDKAPFIELSNLDISLATGLCSTLESAMENTDKRTQQDCTENALKILNLVSNDCLGYAGSLDLRSEEQCLHICALAVQILCLSYVSYCQAHTGALQLFFLQHTLSEVRLFGARAHKSSHPEIVARLQDLTCIGSMLHDSVIVLGPAEHRSSDREAATKFNLLACPQDIIDTWGPGNFIVATDAHSEQRIVRILVGGGSIYLAAEQSHVYHWSPGLHKAFDGKPTMSLTKKILIAASVVVNPNCELNDDDFMRICEEYRDPLGTFEPYWTIEELQAGIQAGQYLNMIYNQTWAKKTGRTLKELLMLKPLNEVIPFLESTWGLQVSFCTGLARRVKIRELLADVLPAFVERKIPAPPEWTELRDSHGILDILRQGDLAAWLKEIAKHAQCYGLTCALIRCITMLLHDTGIDPSGTHFVVAWVPSQSHLPLQCIRFQIENTNFWTRVLQDSGDCATFAYFTTTCLEIQGHGCRNMQSSWHGEMVLLETEVQRHIDRIHNHTTMNMPWRLEDGQRYPIGRLQASQSTQLCARVQLPDPSQIPRLIVSRSEISSNFLLRILRKQSIPERIRERQTLVDQVQRAFIASRNIKFTP